MYCIGTCDSEVLQTALLVVVFVLKTLQYTKISPRMLSRVVDDHSAVVPEVVSVIYTASCQMDESIIEQQQIRLQETLASAVSRAVGHTNV